MIDPASLAPRELYQLMINCVVPRPIALVTSLSPQGVVNAAPFSFFNAVSGAPPIVMISVGKRKGVQKDTSSNILHSKEFVVHIVNETIAEQMNITSGSLSPDESEILRAGFTLIPCSKIKTPRIVESPVQMECKLVQHVELGDGAVDVIFGEVVALHLQDGLLKDGRIDPADVRAIGRLGGMQYCRTRDTFEMQRPL